MPQEKIDVVVLGASGFTGKHVLRELLKFCNLGDGKTRRVGIAGTNKIKLSKSLIWALSGTDFSPSAVTIFEADAEDRSSLDYMCSKTREVLNCVVPYQTYGEPVVAACVAAGIDYLDVTGEPEFIDRVLANYDRQALKRGSLVVNAVGFESLPPELGLLFNARQFKGTAIAQRVDSYLAVQSGGDKWWRGNIGTWNSAVLAAEGASSMFSKKKPTLPSEKIPDVPAKFKPWSVHWDENTRTWAVKMVGGEDLLANQKLISRTIATVSGNIGRLSAELDEENPALVEQRKKKWAAVKPLHHSEYICFKTIWGVLGFFLVGLVLTLLSQFKKGKDLLLQYPETFSLGIFQRESPSENDINSSSFQMWFVGKGYSNGSSKGLKSVKKIPDLQVVTRVSGPDVGYITTPISMVQAALIILDERKSLPKGGVLSPGAVFGLTDIQERLESNGVRFDVISTTKI